MRELRELRYQFLIGFIALVILLSPFWIYSNRYFLLTSLFPFKTLDNKIVVDGQGIMDWDMDADSDELFLVDTLNGGIRQLTDDSFQDSKPTISLTDYRIYFLSDRPKSADQETGTGTQTLYYYDISNGSIIDAYPEFTEALNSDNSTITDILVRGDKIGLIESYDSVRCKIVSLIDKRTLKYWTVPHSSIIMDFSESEMTIMTNRKVMKLK